MSNQPPKGMPSVLRNIGIFLLIIFVSCGLLYFSITADTVTLDNPVALAAQAPMPASQRFAIDANKEAAKIRLEKSDLWWLLLPEMEDNVLNDVNRELENYNLSITGYGFHITKKGLWIDLEAMYQSVRLPVHILTSLDFDESGFSLSLAKAKLGPIGLPVANLLSSVDVRMDLDWPVITDITDVAYQQDAIVLTGTLTQDMLSCVHEPCRAEAIGWFSPTHQAVFRLARAEDGFRELLPGLEKDPGSIELLYHDLFTLAQPYEYEAFMKETRNLSHRFFPGIDYDTLETENNSVREKWAFCDGMMDTLVTQVSTDFNNRRFRLKNGRFYFKNAEFDVLNYFNGDTALQIQQLFDVIDQEKFHLILVDSINGYAVKSPVLSRICAEDQQLTHELDRNAAFCVGCVFQGVNGEYLLRYESIKLSGRNNQMSKWLKTVTLSEAEYISLLQEGKIGVWSS